MEPLLTYEFDTAQYAKHRFSATHPLLSFDTVQPVNKKALTKWQLQLRRDVARLIGAINSPSRYELTITTLDSVSLDGYQRETISISVPDSSGLTLFGYLLIPNEVQRPVPAVICLPGHGRGADSIVGIAEDGNQRPTSSPAEYQMDFALQCVSHGYAAFALEQLGFGHRRDAQARSIGPDCSSCSRDSTAALMLGETITGWRVRDAMFAIDYLQTRPEVDVSRIATMGISGGGLTSFFTACVDERVKCCVVSGYFNTFQDSVLSINHCVDNYIPGMLNYAEMPDLAGLCAPRALFVESGAADPIFPLPAFQRAVVKAEQIYGAFGASQQFSHEVFDAGHVFHGIGAFDFMQSKL